MHEHAKATLSLHDRYRDLLMTHIYPHDYRMAAWHRRRKVSVGRVSILAEQTEQCISDKKVFRSMLHINATCIHRYSIESKSRP